MNTNGKGQREFEILININENPDKNNFLRVRLASNFKIAKFNDAKSNEVIEVAEKKVISNNATVGVYYWRKGSDYVKYSEKMIKKNIRVNNEF